MQMVAAQATVKDMEKFTEPYKRLIKAIESESGTDAEAFKAAFGDGF